MQHGYHLQFTLRSELPSSSSRSRSDAGERDLRGTNIGLDLVDAGGDVHAVAEMLEGDVELAVANTVAVDAVHVDGAGVLADLGAAEGVAEGQDGLDLGDCRGGCAGDGLSRCQCMYLP